MKKFKVIGAILAVLVLGGLLLAGTTFPAAGQDEAPPTVMVGEAATPKLSPAVRDLPSGITIDRTLDREEINPMKNPGLFMPDFGLTGTDTKIQDPLAPSGVNSSFTPDPIFTFEGQGDFNMYTPPDTTGDVGPNHYIQMVNVFTAIYDKSGTLLSQFPNNALWAGFGGPCQNDNDGDPIVLYDDMADRWLLSQFALSTGLSMCVAISQTPDPMGAYYLYEFPMPAFPDYPKFGVWPDGYYLGTNTGYSNQYYAHVFERDEMLVGGTAGHQYVSNQDNFLMPADADGWTAPPAGEPGLFYTFFADDYSPPHPAGVDRLAIFEFDVDWTTPANSTWTLVDELPVTPFNYTVCGFFAGNCIPQPGTSQRLDAVDPWPMVRLQYRNFGSHEAMVGNFTVDVDGTDWAGVRWFEVRRNGGSWTLYQEGTYAPDSDHRWMGSIAMDGDGNIALGYSVSSTTTYPSIRYTVHETSDPLGTMQAEATMWAGTGSNTGPYDRWGDYSAMVVDPVDQCTFWYTNEYHDVDESSFMWNTRIGSFRIPGCGVPSGTLTGLVDDGTTGIPGAYVEATNGITWTIGTTTNALGYYTMTLPVDTYDVTASAYGFQPQTATGIAIFEDTVTVQDFTLAPAATYTVDGTVTDATTGWPLYTSIDIDGYPGDPIWTDPVTGYYEVDLAEGITYTFDVAAWVPGYLGESRDVGPLTANVTEDFALLADLAACIAPGYSLSYAYAEGFEANDGGYTHSGTQDEWEWGAPVTWPSACSEGSLCWGTDLDNSYNNSADNQLLSPVIAMPTATPLTALWDQAWHIESASWDHAYAEVSINGGAFQQMWSHTGGTTQTPWQGFNYDISAATGGTVQFRFRFTSDSSVTYNGYYIDNVRVAMGCNPNPGGLVVGNVYDDNTNDPLNGAMVENEDGYSATSVETPADPAVDDGFYTVFSPAGTKTFTATIGGGYSPDIQTPTVVANDTVNQDFYLGAGWLSIDPASFHVTLDMGDSITLPMTLSNTGTAALSFEIQEAGEGFMPSLMAPGTIQWLYRNTEGVPVETADSGTTMAYPGAYRYTPATPSAFNVLVYTDDWIHTTPNTLVQQALANLGLAATVHVDGDYAGFQTSLNTGGPWDLVIWSGENYVPDQAVIDDLTAYLQGGGKLAATYWRQAVSIPTDPLWAEMGFTVFDNYVTPPPAYWWDPGHPLFNNPESAPEWINRVQNSGTSQGTYLEPLANGLALAGYTTAPAPNEAGIILRDDGMALYKGLRDVSTNADDDTDGIPDGTELWMNIMTGMLEGFGGDIPWLSEEPITGTVSTSSDLIIDVNFDAGVPEVDQPGDYLGTMKIQNDTPYGAPEVPVTMTVNVPPTWGKLNGTVTGQGYCDANPELLEEAVVVIEGALETYTVTTDVDGYYQWWLDEANSPADVTVTYPDYEVGSATVTITAGTTTRQDFDLRWLFPCVKSQTEGIEVELVAGYSTRVPISITNTSPVTSTFAFAEQDDGYEPPPVAPYVAPASMGTGANLAQYAQANVQREGQIVTSNAPAQNIILDQQPNQSNGIFADASCDICSGSQVLAENFSLADSVSVGQIVFWTGYFPGDVPIDPDHITVIFHQDNAGLPGAAIYTEADVSYSREQTGVMLFGVHEWIHTLTLGTPVSLDPGNYWVEIYNDTGFGTDDMFWEVGNPDTVGNGLTGSAFAFEAPGSSWNYDGATELAIQLIESSGFVDAVPWVSEEPITGTLLADSVTDIAITFDASVTEVVYLGSYYATLNINSDDPISPTYSIPVTMTVVAADFGAAVHPNLAFMIGEPGDTVSYTLTLTNTGNVPDIFDVTVSSVWTTTTSLTVGPIMPGESEEVLVTVEIPTDAVVGEFDLANVTFTSQGDPTEMADASLRTLVVIPEYVRYLPITYR